MGLDELRRIVAESDRGDWNVISCFGFPSYLPWSPDGDFNEHLARAAYRPDISIGLAWGIRDNENFRTDWAQSFANDQAESFLADILYNGMLVSREILVVVDGGRTYLPLPRRPGELVVDRWDRDFARLLDQLQLEHGVGGGIGDPSRSDFDSYFRRAGFTVGE
jgi:hypothetical protein